MEFLKELDELCRKTEGYTKEDGIHFVVIALDTLTDKGMVSFLGNQNTLASFIVNDVINTEQNIELLFNIISKKRAIKIVNKMFDDEDD